MQRRISGGSTHAWFPKEMFDQTEKQDAHEGTWFFGRKDTFDLTGDRGGSGYVALFTARSANWTNEQGNIWNNKEIMTEGGRNIWVCIIGNEKQFGSFDTFREEVLNSYLNVSLTSLECSFDIPRVIAPPGRSPRLELFYNSRTGKFAGDNIDLDNFQRFENKYTSQMVTTPPRGGGTRPQVEGFATIHSVPFGSLGYTITHPATGLMLDHNLVTPSRAHTSQATQTLQHSAPHRRLEGNS